MIPSSRQWTMIPSPNILVYPISYYVITSDKKSPVKHHRRYHKTVRKCRWSDYKHRSGNSKCGIVHSSDTDSHCSESAMTTTTSSLAKSDRPSSSSTFHRERRRSRHHHHHNEHYLPFDRCRLLVGKLSPDRRRSQNVNDEKISRKSSFLVRRREQSLESPERRGELKWKWRDEVKWERQEKPKNEHPEKEVQKRLEHKQHIENGIRCSANVVLLAHGNRSLHVLVIQRSKISVSNIPIERRKIHMSCNTVIRYKLPGGQLMLTDDELENLKQEDRNACACYDDQRWYNTALGHFKIQWLGLSNPNDTTDVDNSMLASSGLSEDVQSISVQQQQTVLLGKWYRTQDKEARQQTGNNTHCFYYPYKPAHISHQAVEHKRVYAVPDVHKLFHDQLFRLKTPRAKVKTVQNSDGMTITTTTTYRCKFVPLARLHENNRLYGPVLSSLPTVLSSMNLTYM